MSGSPLLRLVLALVVMAVVGVALAALTSSVVRSAPDPREPAATEPSIRRVPVTFRFSSPVAPARIRVDVLGETVVTLVDPSPESRAETTLEIPPAGVDAVVRAEWGAPAPGAPNALRVRAAVDGGAAHDRTAWGAASATEVLTFSAR